MVRINRSFITKAIFGISVVAVTATAGVAGFAQAARHNLRTGDGYGGNGALIRAAVAEFERALGAATTKFQQDVASCVAGLGGDTAATTTFQHSSATAAGDFSAQAANPTAFSNTTRFDQHFASADATLQAQLDTDSSRLTTALDRIQASNAQHSAFRQCMNTARHTFRDAVNAARTKLRDTLRGIFA